MKECELFSVFLTSLKIRINEIYDIMSIRKKTRKDNNGRRSNLSAIQFCEKKYPILLTVFCVGQFI
jgi:hypothetical protein